MTQMEHTNTIDTSSIDEWNDTETALAWLLANDYLFALPVKVGDNQYTSGLFLNLNDTFAYACAYCRPVSCYPDSDDIDNEVIELYKAIIRDPKYGWLKWASIKEGMQPIRKLKEKMIDHGLWDSEMEALPLNGPDIRFNNLTDKSV
jgi:hypothetical protein